MLLKFLYKSLYENLMRTKQSKHVREQIYLDIKKPAKMYCYIPELLQLLIFLFYIFLIVTILQFSIILIWLKEKMNMLPPPSHSVSLRVPNLVEIALDVPELCLNTIHTSHSSIYIYIHTLFWLLLVFYCVYIHVLG